VPAEGFDQRDHRAHRVEIRYDIVEAEGLPTMRSFLNFTRRTPLSYRAKMPGI
jgi:hypothetical protein